MREIKFRGKDKVNGIWVYGNLEIPLINQSISKCYILGYSYGQYQKIEVDPTTVGQYVGMKDGKGREIYEGDIIKNIRDDSFKPYIAGVYYADGCFGTSWFNPIDEAYAFVPLFSWEVKVIGNTNDNQEQLTPTKQPGE